MSKRAEAIRLRAQGLSLQEIGKRLGISGASAFGDREVQEVLQLTQEQNDRIREIQVA